MSHTPTQTEVFSSGPDSVVPSLQDSSVYLADIPLSLAVSAFNGTSFTPEKRGESYRNDYAATLARDYGQLRKEAEKGQTLDLLDAEFSRYRDGYRSRMRAWLSSHSRCISSMITGTSNFPVRRAEKRNAVEHKRLEELISYRERALTAARRNLRPDLRPIMSGDSDALNRLNAELEKLEKRQAYMTSINKHHKRFIKDPESLTVADLSDADRYLIRNYKPAYSWEPHPFAPFELTNNGASIRRVKSRIEQLTKAKATPDTQIDNTETGIRVEDSPADNRIRLFFPDKPDADVRTKLKKNGFRWSPSIGAWQAYRNNWSMELARTFLPQVAA